MTVEKTAQLYNVDGDIDNDSSYSNDYDIFIDDEESMNAKDKEKNKDDKVDEADEVEEIQEEPKSADEIGGELIVLEFDNPKDTIQFSIPELPGALDFSDIPEPEEFVVEEEEKSASDPWDWKSNHGHIGFLPWLQSMVNSTPKHSGHDVAGLDRAMAYIELLLKEVSKAMRTDFKGEIDVNNCESMADGMYKALDAMEDRKGKVLKFKYPNRYKGKKSSWVEQSGLVKNGQKSTNINGITIVVPLFISRLARVLINGTVSAGHSLEDMYDDLKKDYELTKREEAELQQLLADMGYPVYQDRGLLNEQVDKSKSDNKDWAASYHG